MSQNELKLLRLSHYPIYQQLLLEESLLREQQGNWCLINQGSPPAIVMGISGKKEELIHPLFFQEDPFPLIKRYSGGGTVVIDENSLLITFICEKSLHPFEAYPEPIMRWAETLYQPIFSPLPFALKENDFVIQDRKCGGNAQYIQKNRWVHHTSFLWDFSAEKMNYLLHPNKTPSYRNHRSHLDFLCGLKNYFNTQEEWLEKFLHSLREHYCIQDIALEHVGAPSPSTRHSTLFIR